MPEGVQTCLMSTEIPMPVRATWRPPWYAWVLLGILALVLTHKFEPGRLEGHWLFLTPLLVLGGVLIARKLWERPPAMILCGAVALSIFSGEWARIGLGGLPFDRLLIVMVLLALLLRAPGVVHLQALRVRNIHLLLGLTIIYVILSAAAAGTLTSEVGLLSLIDRVGVTPYLMFLVAPAIFAGQRERNLLLATLVGVGAYLGLTAIFESLGPHSLVFPHYIVYIDTELPGHRAGGPFGSSVAEGFATLACAVASAIAVVQWRGRRKRYLAGMVAVVCVFGCFLTLERGVWIAALAGISITALFTRAGRRMLIPGICAGALLIGGTLVLSPALSSKTSARVGDQNSVWDRQNMTAAGLRMVAAKPLFGFGFGKYPTESLEYFRESPNYPMNGYSMPANCVGESCVPEKQVPLHDTYIALAVELGLIGGLLWLSSFVLGMGIGIFSPGSAALRPWKLGLLTLTICYLAICLFDPYQASFPDLLLWVWAGVAMGGSPASMHERRGKIAVPMRSAAAWSTG
jgi:putative inorganic carbon (hco3(-)) transporter